MGKGRFATTQDEPSQRILLRASEILLLSSVLELRPYVRKEFNAMSLGIGPVSSDRLQEHANSPVTFAPNPGASLVTWTAAFEIELPASSWYSIHPSTYDRISAELDGTVPIFRVGRERLGVSFKVTGRDLRDAQSAASQGVQTVLRLLGLPGDSLASAQIGEPCGWTPAAPPELGPGHDAGFECLGVGEVAEVLNVSKQRVSQLARQRGFPAPWFRLRATPVWRRADIEDFKRQRESRSAI